MLKKPAFDSDRRRKHPHFLVTIFYNDKDQFGRVYTDETRAKKFAARQQKSPLVQKTKVEQLS